MRTASAAAYAMARDRYAQLGVDTERAIDRATAVRLSVHCWQGDDVRGFERRARASAAGGIQATGSHPGAARDGEEMRRDLDAAIALLPGVHSVNLHAMYAEATGAVDRDRLEARHFEAWIAWASDRGLGLDFNATLFAHPKADAGVTLSSPDAGVRAFWIEHVRRCRAIGQEFGRRLEVRCVHDLWLPDGSKDEPVDRIGHRLRLVAALDEIYQDAYEPSRLVDALESKLFGIGSESFVVGSHELYLGYCLTRAVVPCLDMGHFHPTESVADKISALLPFFDALLLHVSRGVRWDSDHVAVLDDPLRQVALEIARAEAFDRVHLALDYFDASINRVAAWVIGARAVRQAVLQAMLEPTARLRAMEAEGDLTGRLVLREASKGLPWGAVWDELCRRADVPCGWDWLPAVRDYEQQVLFARLGRGRPRDPRPGPVARAP